MSRTTQRPQLLLDIDQRNELIQLSQSRTAPFREVQRAAILLQYASVMSHLQCRIKHDIFSS